MHELKRSLGLVSAISITVGAVIGSGIFMKALDVSRNLPDATWVYGTWLVLGIICLFGAFAYAELGTMFPEAGGMYAFLRESWGRFPAFLYGWTFLLVINSGTLAALAAAFAENLSSLTPLSQTEQALLAAGMIFVLALVNHFGVDWGALLQNVSTFAKVGALAAIVVGGFFFAASGAQPAQVAEVVPAVWQDHWLQALVAACIPIFWAYEGWYQLPYNAAELKNPARDLPRGLIWGLLLLIAIYLLVNAVYIQLVPLAEMRTLTNAVDVPKTAIARIVGGAGNWLALLISISVLGAANPNLLSSPRAFYAMAKDGLVPASLMYVHPRYRTPTIAIWSQAIWGMGLVVVLKTFKDLTEYVVFASLLFYALTVAGVYVLRVRAADRPRTYRCWGFPVTPLLFIAVTLAVDWLTLMNPHERTNALIGLAIIAAGVPVYFLTKRR